MSTCSRCHQRVSSQTVTCPHCGYVLKAHGHPGITLHRAEPGNYLCRTCLYDADDSCNFPQRPYATECTLYRNQAQAEQGRKKTIERRNLQDWVQRHLVWFVLLGIVLVAIFLAR
uniref:DZANK-type domain-containing protein n=1 Tax=Cyanothece sp. (strain PCC 7425 / ATCC 29141) TaxID=395961 RepID=B8HUH3_CYAP4